MLKLIFASDDKMKQNLAQWVKERTFMHRDLIPGTFECIGVAHIDPVAQKSRVIAVCLFHDYFRLGDGGKIEVSMAADDPKWAQPGMIRAILSYPFVQLDCHVLVATTNKTNKRTRRFLEGINFKEKGVIPNRPYADDTMIYALRREDAQKWLGKIKVREAA